ncbi:2-amino-4-hydroxy-6-hydroxymethyldihydropteridine diphosphokinase [Psychrobacter sp. FDAARGOS_221]|uniref:2-amino-4-hydroxy-6- hydroxymethyldihydropteridine diphosphokinase n=1 Tax=Psychrobacter sp. FDAARGOS_221 TaxID=1975705 RepID=UPI000BB54B58|nr:2-amino-4-hydroxy-6-hydroxymethyldihydropteridine diphosphokinase [Psychrobacter sp. FDAARGOS_221]PNK61027.1 2-amino-4-hydroxy-6-hydroxymethyldihydropteridine diphosphokinase [Psychrobacter sp. FDAARGOS_221]
MDQASQHNYGNYHRCYLGLGSNLTTELGTPSEHIQRAIAVLADHPSISHVKASSLYESKPMGPQDQPDFINAVVEVDTRLSPHDLLSLCQHLEQQAQRVRLRRWGERSLDVDVLLYADQSVNTPTLTVPHPGVTERNFVLIPLAELNSDLTIDGKLLIQLPAAQDWTGLSRLSSK